MGVKRTSDELQREVAALIKHSADRAADAKALVRTAADLRQKADTIKAALEDRKRARDGDRKHARKDTPG
jgi:hypothetical protein